MTASFFEHRRSLALSAVVTLALLAAGCLWSKRTELPSTTRAEESPFPIAPALWLSPSLNTAVLSYQNACGETSTMSIAEPIAGAMRAKLSRAFAGLHAQPSHEPKVDSDGIIEVGMGFKQINLEIPPKVKGSYPATVKIGMEVAFVSSDGNFLLSKKLQGIGHGQVEVSDQSCEVTGLGPIVQDAIESVSDASTKHIAESMRIREYAEHRKAVRSAASAIPNQRPSTPSPEIVPGGAAASSAVPSVRQSVSGGGAAQSTALAFRAIVRDESQDHILQQDESLTIEVEVKNEGYIEAKHVEVVVGGALAAHFPPAVAIGDVQPGEIKRAYLTNQVTEMKETLRGELVLSLRSLTPLIPTPPAKKFTLLIKPERSASVPGMPDIDTPPTSLTAAKQTKAMVIAIGVGKFRNERIQPVKYAGHDAEVMAAYLRAIGGIPDERVHVLTDQFALKEDIAETFDEWLPKRVDASTVVYVYFAGKAVVDGVSGAVSLVPFDGAATAKKRLYPVRHIQEALSKLPIQRAIMMFEVSLDPTPGADPAATPQADWGEGTDEEKDHVMWMVGNRSLQEAHAYEPAKHSLFTYHLLRGLQGLADLDRDGTVTAGELCTFARGEVIQAAREQFGNAQHPLCSPPPGQGAVVRIHPMARGNNPKPSAPVKKTEPAADSPSPGQQPLNVGPRP